MYKMILWGLGADYNFNYNSIKYMELTKQMEVVAVTARDVPVCKSIDGYRVINKEIIRFEDFDYIIVMNKKFFMDIRAEIIALGVNCDKILSDYFLDVPNIVLDDYISLKKAKRTIVSNNCWGGIISHSLGLENMSPFKNLFLKDDDYIKLISNFEGYIKYEPKFVKWNIDIHSKKEYPVLQLKDIEIHCNHDKEANEAILKWKRRCKKINLNDMFIEMYTCDRNIAEKFCELEQYDKKICFVPFKTYMKDMMQLSILPEQEEFWEAVNQSAGNKKNGYVYNIVDLLNGIRTERIVWN